jgi:glycogen debranching enzyme
MPELYGGWAAEDGPLLAYPSTCRPQAWSAAAVFVLVWAALGLTPDSRQVRPSPAFASWFPLTVDGVVLGGRRVRVTVDAAGVAEVS